MYAHFNNSIVDADKVKPTKPNSCNAHMIPNKCTLLAHCDVLCKISLSGVESQMKIILPCQKASPLVAKVAFLQSKQKTVEYPLTINAESGTLIKELMYSLGNIELKIKLSVTMNKVSDGRISFKVNE